MYALALWSGDSLQVSLFQGLAQSTPLDWYSCSAWATVPESLGPTDLTSVDLGDYSVTSMFVLVLPTIRDGQ